MTYSVPSTEHPQSSSACNERSAWGQKAGEPREPYLLRRLARSRYFAIALGLTIVISMGAIAFVPMIDMHKFGLLGAVGFCIIILLANLDQIITSLEDANDLCEIRWEKSCKLHSEIDHLKQDVEHWKALSFTKRGGLSVVKDGAAAGISCSDKQEAPAAVVHEFPNPKGVA